MVSEYSNNPKIKIVLKEIEEFYQYRHKDNWIKNSWSCDKGFTVK
jgi:hypothetical protein